MAAIGAGVAATITTQYEPKETLFVFALSFLGGLFPDLDIHSTPSKWAARIGVVASVLLLNNNPQLAAIIGIAYMLTKVDKHRGWTHSIFLPPLIFLFSNHYGFPLYGLAFGFGVYIHLLADSKLLKKFK